MKIEKIFRNIPKFHDIVLDKILFESKYPVLFTCKNEQDIYLFICCLVNADKVEWIGTKTTYENLIELLENKVTIREAFLNITEDKIVIKYNGQNVEYVVESRNSIPDHLLPAVGEYIDAEDDEYEEEIATFKKRNENIEYTIKPRMNKFLWFQYKGIYHWTEEDCFVSDLGSKDVMQYRMKINHNQKVVFVKGGEMHDGFQIEKA